jgi:hypothetical protein
MCGWCMWTNTIPLYLYSFVFYATPGQSVCRHKRRVTISQNTRLVITLH